VLHARGTKKTGAACGPRRFQNAIPGLLGGSAVSRSSGISRSSSVGSSGVNSSAGSVDCGTGSVGSSGTGIASGVNCLGSAIYGSIGSFGRHFGGFGGLVSGFGRLFGGLAAAAGDHQQCNWQTQPCLAKSSAHVVILLYPQQLTARFRQELPA
jgi:hypothetical protein